MIKREHFVVAYRHNGHLDIKCLACHIYKGHETNGWCKGFCCSHELFDNTRHIPVVTMKECKMDTAVCCNECTRCVMFLKFGIKRA